MGKKKSKKSKKSSTTDAAHAQAAPQPEQPWTHVLAAANAVPDIMADFQAFSRFSRNGADVVIRNKHATSLPPATREQLVEIFESNMKALYQASDWGYDPQEKRAELFANEARYLLVYNAQDAAETAAPVGFAHFRFVEDDGVPVLYLYEVQLAASAQRHGLGKFLMQLLLLVARRHGLELLVLTVFKSNTGAMRFYRERLGFQIDETSPSACGDHSQSYEILSKSVVRG